MSDTERVEEGEVPNSDARREQSTIVFPYLDLDAGIEVARAIYNRGGLGGCDVDELAAEMGQSLSGAFRLKTGSARIFDLIEKSGRSAFKLSELGLKIIMPETERAARAESFLRVPLYLAIFDKYRGKTLPPMKALEREMLALGVSSKQTDKARQAFERSARQAGYFEYGDDRLVRPRVDISARAGEEIDSEKNSGDAKTKQDDDANSYKNGKSNKSEVDDLKLHPFIIGLLKTLPEPETEWKVSGRSKWLQTAASIFGLIYKGEGEINISITRQSENGD